MISGVAETIIAFFRDGFIYVLNNFISWILGFFTSLGNLFVDGMMGILTSINNVLPAPNTLILWFYQLEDIISPYVGYLLDMTFIDSAVFTYFISSFIFRIVARKNTYLVKLVVGWFNKIIP